MILSELIARLKPAAIQYVVVYARGARHVGLSMCPNLPFSGTLVAAFLKSLNSLKAQLGGNSAGFESASARSFWMSFQSYC